MALSQVFSLCEPKLVTEVTVPRKDVGKLGREGPGKGLAGSGVRFGSHSLSAMRLC